MAKVQDQMAATAFTITTELTFEQVTVAATDAAFRASGPVTKARQTSSVQGERIDFSASRLKTISIAAFTLTFQAGHGSAPNTLTLTPGDFLTTRPSIAGFIPVGPATCAGLPVVQKFSAIMRTAAET